MSVWNSLWRSNYSFETSAYTYFEVLLQPQPLSTLLSVLVSPHFSKRSNRHLFSPSRFMRRVAFQCKAGLVAQTSVCVASMSRNSNHTG